MSGTSPKLFLEYHKYSTFITESRGNRNKFQKFKNKENALPESVCLYRYCNKCKMVVDLERKPYFCSCRIELFSKYSYCCLYVTFSKILLKTGKTEILRYRRHMSSSRLSGNTPAMRDLLMIFVKHGPIISQIYL